MTHAQYPLPLYYSQVEGRTLVIFFILIPTIYYIGSRLERTKAQPQVTSAEVGDNKQSNIMKADFPLKIMHI